jgi:3-(3-hydroxy-phenyl)propionate hydroxylase
MTGHGTGGPADDTPEVLVAGAGPTGLLHACELLRRGVRVRVVDRAEQPAAQPRALSLWPRALDILDDLGIGAEIRRASTRIDTFRYFSGRREIAGFGFRPDLASRILPQPATERLLTRRLHALGGRVERGVRLLFLDGVPERGEGVTAMLEHPGGGVERVRARYLVGADGASSTVRRQISTEFAGTTYEMAFALVDARIEGRALPSDEIHYYQSPAGTLVIVPAPDGVFRFLSVMPRGTPGAGGPAGGAEPEVTVPMMQALVDERGPRGVRIAEPVWRTVFRVHARRAADFRRGPVFIMGDAAHVHSPAGGQGMNNGLQDAHNLGWKLAAVLRGESPASVLDGYAAERAEATHRIVRDTDLQTRAWVVNGRARTAVRDAAFRVLDRTGLVSRAYAPVMAGRRLRYAAPRATQWPSGRTPCRVRAALPGGVRPGSVLPRAFAVAYGIAGPAERPSGWTLVLLDPPGADPHWAASAARLTGRHPAVRTVRVRDAGAELGCHRAGYHLVRPDGHIAAHGHAADLDRLAAELGLALGPAVADPHHYRTPAARPAHEVPAPGPAPAGDSVAPASPVSPEGSPR